MNSASGRPPEPIILTQSTTINCTSSQFGSWAEWFRVYLLLCIVDEKRTMTCSSSEVTHKRLKLILVLFVHFLPCLSCLKREAHSEHLVLDPTNILCDFQLNAINAFRRYFPMARLNGCIQSFGRSAIRSLQKVILESILFGILYLLNILKMPQMCYKKFELNTNIHLKLILFLPINVDQRMEKFFFYKGRRIRN